MQEALASRLAADPAEAHIGPDGAILVPVRLPIGVERPSGTHWSVRFRSCVRLCPERMASVQAPRKGLGRDERQPGPEKGRTERRILQVSGATMTPKPTVVRADPGVMSGTPVFVGTRVPVQSLFDYLEGGDTLDEFLRQFPSVKREQAIAALEQARDSVLTSARPA